MITVLIECKNQSEALAATLSALVPGAVEGLISDVIVLDGGSEDETATVAQAAGCRFETSSNTAEAMAAARGRWLLLLEPGARPMPGWIESVGAFVARETRPARFKRARSHGGSILTRFRERRSPLAFGLLVRKSDAVAKAGNAGGARDVARSVGTVELDCALIPAGRRRA